MFKGLGKSGNNADSAINLRPLSVEISPDRPFYAIGDLHGCFDAMHEALAKTDDDIEAQSVSDPAVVFLGDSVDRGPKSAQVLEFLFNLNANEPDAVICLKGNHEQMLLDFVDAPDRDGKRWLRYGGVETLESYDIPVPDYEADREQFYAAAEELADALPDGALPWLRALPMRWASGNLQCVHAAMDPAVAVHAQSSQTLLWGCDTFETTERTDGNWVVHGHTVVGRPTWEFGRVALDTGCYFTGVLTVAAFTGNGCRIL